MNTSSRSRAVMLVTLASACLVAGSALGQAERTTFVLDGSARYDSNVTRAGRSSDILSDRIVSAGATATRRILLSERSGVMLHGTLGLEHFDRYSDLDNASLGAKVDFRFKPTPGYGSPWLSLNASTELRGHLDSTLRDGLLSKAGVMAGKRLTTELNARVGYVYDRRVAFDGSVYDMDGHRVFASADYSLTRKLTLYASYSYRDGDVVSTGVRTEKIQNAFDAAEPDDAFGRGVAAPSEPQTELFIPFPGATPIVVEVPPEYLNDDQYALNQRFAYRLHGTTHTARVGLSYAIGRMTLFDLNARHFDTSASGGNDYDGIAVTASIGLLFK